jgi:hypothetical protein
MIMLFSSMVPGLFMAGSPAMARDDIPESLRIEQQTEKAYNQKPVVPIERGNAHHRNLGGGGDMGVPATPPGAVTPGPVTPPAAAPTHDDNDTAKP